MPVAITPPPRQLVPMLKVVFVLAGASSLHTIVESACSIGIGLPL